MRNAIALSPNSFVNDRFSALEKASSLLTMSPLIILADVHQQAYKIDLCELSQFVSFFSLFLLQKNSKQRWRSGIHAKPKGFILEATKKEMAGI